MPKRIRVALTDDHRLVRQALTAFIDSRPGFEVVINERDCRELVRTLGTEPVEVDVFLLDLYSPEINAGTMLPDIVKLRPDAGVVIMSMYHNEAQIAELFDMGINAFISKADDHNELIKALETASTKEVFRNDFYREAFRLLKIQKVKPPVLPLPSLSKTDLEIVQLLWEDKSNKEIADILGLSLSAVEKIKYALKEKTGARSNLGLIKYALSNGLVYSNGEGIE
ncbi:MAG: response regulator transcription factor [Chitinophagaceae bacterium]|nr:response regulator transcription factor [Chitinophagaceae bacterium]MCW5929824.1 response regulator transcription factor [Chitinophagaceae bacterium]